MPFALYLKGTDQLVTELDDAQLRCLVDLLEEEHPNDHDYYIDEAVIAYMEEKGADKVLVGSLRRALGARDTHRDPALLVNPEEGIEVDWREA